jgi:hypothetical protein
MFSLHVIGTSYGCACVRPRKERAAQFTNRTKDSYRETLAQCRTISTLMRTLKRILGNGLGKLYGAGCECRTI